MKDSSRRGFTLIELLVVIAIIGILASIVLASLSSARKKGRDSRRIADVKQLQLALALYLDACQTYPATLTAGSATGCNNGLVSNGYISVIPTDPGNGQSYRYTPYSPGSSATTNCSGPYHLGASLEVSGNNALSSDADGPPGSNAICSATGAPAAENITNDGLDTTKCNSSDYGSYCYDVRP